MSFLIGLLTFVLFLNCFILVFLVLIQLPKKEAGLGLAFGAGAADALFGAGSGNVLTKATKYVTGSFFILTIGVGLLFGYEHRRGVSEIERELKKGPISQPALPPATLPTPVAAASNAAATPAAAPATGTSAPVVPAPVPAAAPTTGAPPAAPK